MVIDDELAMVGTTNQDIRSYSLNFEVSTFIYNPDIAWMLAQVFEEDIEKSVLLTDEIIKTRVLATIQAKLFTLVVPSLVIK